MSGIIVAIISLIGPLIGDLLKSWLDKLLKKAGDKLTENGVSATAGDEFVSRRLLETALDMTPRVRVFRRALLRGMIAEVPQAIASGAKKLPKATVTELTALAAKDE